jgi:hypothetical protein
MFNSLKTEDITPVTLHKQVFVLYEIMERVKQSLSIAKRHLMRKPESVLPPQGGISEATGEGAVDTGDSVV